MATLLELAADIVSSHASANQLSTDDLVKELQRVYAALQQLEAGAAPEAAAAEESKGAALTVKQAFKKDQVICLICGKGGMKTLARHLGTAHGMKPGQYRKQFGIPRTQPLAAKSFSESRKQMAQERNLAGNLAKAREIRMANLAGKKSAAAKKPAAPRKKAPKA
ncbi:MAG TPA: MucR family transcriptional regulator [Verrucomicrobiae bacterium]|nr:MucR family transcriptional regulator [Verrucomicrobiae bacterium]